MLKIVEHSLHMFAGKSWADFVPPEAQILKAGGDLQTCELAPVGQMNLLTLATLSVSGQMTA